MKAFALALGFTTVTGCGAASPPPAAEGAGASRLELTLVSNDGQPSRLPFAGEITVIDYFAPSCAPCRAKLPALVARRAELATHGARLVLVGVLDSSDSTEAVEQALAAWGLPGEHFFIDRDGVSAKVAKVNEFPTTQVFDATRTLRFTGRVAATADDIVAAVASLP